jgi:hypothetical protein
VLEASGLFGVQVNVVRAPFQAHDIGMIGPSTPPWWRSTYCSIPAIIGWLNEAITVVVVETAVAPGNGLTEASETEFAAVVNVNSMP